MKLKQPIWLASKSPRRRLMLAEAAIDLRIQAPDIDDANLRPGTVTPEQWVAALAYLKARRAAEMLRLMAQPVAHGTVLGADTVCVLNTNEILGQPRDADDARRMLLGLSDAEHRTITGVCLLDLDTGQRSMFCDTARVIMGPISNHQIDAYVASNQWRGKAGAYNLSERIEAGWPIQCLGDCATVMGLPMKRLKPLLVPVHK